MKWQHRLFAILLGGNLFLNLTAPAIYSQEGIVEEENQQAQTELEVKLVEVALNLNVSNPTKKSELKAMEHYQITDEFGQVVYDNQRETKETISLLPGKYHIQWISPAKNNPFNLQSISLSQDNQAEHDLNLENSQEDGQNVVKTSFEIKEEEASKSLKLNFTVHYDETKENQSEEVLDEDSDESQLETMSEEVDLLEESLSQIDENQLDETFSEDSTSLEESDDDISEESDVMEGKGTLSFTITDQESGASVAGVTIEINHESYTSDEAGQIKITDLPTGVYTYKITQLPENYEGELESQIEVTSGAMIEQPIVLEKKELPASSEETATVNFKVLDQEGESVPHAKIEVDKQVIETDENGLAITQELLAGSNHDYQVIELPEGYTVDEDSERGTTIVNLDDETQEIIHVHRQEQTATVTLHVVDQEGQAVPNVKVLFNEETKETDSQGGVSFDQVKAGEYRYQLVDLPEDESVSDPQTITVEAGENVDETIILTKLERTAPLIFEIKDQNKQAVEGVAIHVNELDQTVTTDAQGLADFGQVKEGAYQYELDLPEGYEGTQASQINLNSQTSHIEIQLKHQDDLKAHFTLTDEEGNPIEGVTVMINGESQTSDANGQLVFEKLKEGSYDYQITSLPEGYQLDQNSHTLTLNEETQQINVTLKKEKPKKKTQTVQIQITTSEGDPVPNAKVQLAGTEVTTNAQGLAVFNQIEIGQYTYYITQIPEGYTLDKTQGEIKLTAENEVKEKVLVKRVPTKTVTTATIETSVEANKEVAELSGDYVPFIDEETGVEVYVNAQDAGHVANLTVKKQSQPLNPQPSVLEENKETDIYDISLTDEKGQVVELTRICEVRVPKRVDTQSISVVRIDGTKFANVTRSNHIPESVSFRTQQLGTFAVIYNPKQAEIKPEEKKEEVSEEKKKDDLPKTGEVQTIWKVTLAILLCLFGIKYLLNSRKLNKE